MCLYSLLFGSHLRRPVGAAVHSNEELQQIGVNIAVILDWKCSQISRSVPRSIQHPSAAVEGLAVTMMRMNDNRGDDEDNKSQRLTNNRTERDVLKWSPDGAATAAAHRY